MAILVINRSESYCLGCSKGRRFQYADPRENGHITALGWSEDLRGEPGCGEPWEYITSDYRGGVFENIEEHYFGFRNLEGIPVLNRTLDV